jgi:hypothetical protein
MVPKSAMEAIHSMADFETTTLAIPVYPIALAAEGVIS